MIPSLLLPTLSLFATPVFISEVHATREPGHLRVEVRGEAGIDPEAARTRVDGDRLLLVLGGTRVRADNRSWSLDEGVGEIRAHRHPNEIELEVPIVGNGCSGPVELEGTATGLTALVGCDDAGPARAAHGRARAKVSATVAEGGEVPAPAAKPTPTRASEKAALDALVALPEDEPAPAAAPKVAAAPAKVPPAMVAAPAKAAILPTPTKAAAPEPTGPVATPPAKPLFLPTPAAEVSEAADRPSESSAPRLRAVSLPAVILAGLAIAAYIVARRRRVPKLKQIQILETASLGPKRSLVVARVGEETLVLGTSEAGITLLRTSGEGLTAALPTAMAASGVTAPVFNLGPGPAAVAQAAALPVAVVASQPSRAMNTFVARTSVADGGEVASVAASDLSGAARAHAEEMAQPLMEALADIPEPEAREQATPAGPAVKGVTFRAIEGGLASLFGGGRSSSATGAGRATTARFDDILEDSLEDQELRRKLAAGLSARIR